MPGRNVTASKPALGLKESAIQSVLRATHAYFQKVKCPQHEAHGIERFKMSGVVLLVLYASTGNGVSSRPTLGWAYCDKSEQQS
jgi:hypothetical protein